jgi:hypothetical protein
MSERTTEARIMPIKMIIYDGYRYNVQGMEQYRVGREGKPASKR